MKTQRLFTVMAALTTMMIQFCGMGPAASAAELRSHRATGIPDYFNTPNYAYSPPLRKFVDTLPGLDSANQNNLGQYIPVGIPDTTTYPGSDYYEIEMGQFREQMHGDLPAVSPDKTSGGTLLRGYRQTNATGPGAAAVNQYHFLGPIIIAQKNRPVRIKFTNVMPTGVAGNLFVPVDTTIMGSGEFEINYDPETKAPIPMAWGVFTQNRAVIHLHGGRTPWISDGTAHQWVTPAGEKTRYKKGVSVSYVPDMWFRADGATITECAGQTTCNVAGATNNPGEGSHTYYYTNEQSSRLMFYHEHSWGITRQGVYVGGAAGYIVKDDTEQTLIDNGLIPGKVPGEEIPLVIMDKTYVDGDPTSPTYILNTDPTWIWGSRPGTVVPWDDTNAVPVTGDLWWPHVYMPAQNPYNPDQSGIAAYGRWHYGPWFWPPTNDVLYGPVANEYYDPSCVPNAANDYFCQPPERPGTPNPSWGAEAFMDTPVINGTAYPVLEVEPKAYRFRILNAAHDRFFNLQLYTADPAYSFPGQGLTEVKMVPADLTPGFPELWPTDGRVGGVPDPATRGPAIVQIGSEGGFLPGPVVLPNQPINWNYDPTTFTAGLVLQQNEGGGTCMLGPAERADIIVDFSNFAGKTLILYNDAPAPWPALDPHYDFFTDDPDNRSMGGADTTPPGYGPNTRTIMQIRVSGSGGTAPPNDYDATAFAALQNAFKGPNGVFATGQEPIIVGQTAYNDAYGMTFPSTYPNWGLSGIASTTLSFMRPDGSIVSTYPMKFKAIQDEMGEVFDEYGRMSAKLGLEVADAPGGVKNFALQNFVDPPTEIVARDQVQIWKITQNGVDTHPVHFHFFEVQVINRVGWDGFMYLPDPNEIGWKDTVRISPLEDTIVALRPARMFFPFTVPESIRPLNPAFPMGSTVGFSNIDPLTGQALPSPTINNMHNFGHEYLWHCHILSHEEQDMMRVLVVDPNSKVDILWRNISTGFNFYWYLDNITFVGSADIASETDLSWMIVGRGDFDNDGQNDILWRNSANGQNRVWYMNRSVMTGASLLNPSTVANQNWRIVGTGDFNSDGYVDILWRNVLTGEVASWYMNGIDYQGIGFTVSETNPNWLIVGVGDFNNDGKPDILWRNTLTGEVGVWYMNGVTYQGYAMTTTEADQNWTIVGVGDFNEDIRPDILWRNISTGANRVWYMDGMQKIGEAELLPAVTDQNWKIEG
jgi:FtsP/CotA-like multicopper oxidase with cupredoxin domain